MGKVLNYIAAGILIVASYVFPPAAPLFLLAANYYLRQTVNLPQYAHYVQTSAADPQQGVPVVYGSTRMGLRVLDTRVDTTSADWRALWIVGAVCHGSQDGNGIQALNEIYFDQYLAFNIAGTLQNRYKHNSNNFAYIQAKLLGTTAQDVHAGTIGTAFPSVYTANYKGAGIAILIVSLWYHQDLYHGVPNVNVLVQGNRVFDVRDSTWKFSDNPALCIYDYLTSPIYGAGISASEIDTASFQTIANYCDELVNSYPSGPTQKRFTCNGALDTNNSVKDNLAILLSSCRGNLAYDGGKYRLVVRRPVTQATLTLDKSNILGDWSFQVPGTREALNIVRTRYVDPTNNYQVQTVQFPEPGATNSYLTDDNNFTNSADIDLPMTNNRYTASQIGMTHLRESRSSISCQVTCSETALQLQIGDLVPVTHETPGWSAKLFHVMAMELLQENQVRLTLIEYQSSAYTLDTIAQDPGNPGTTLPDPFGTINAPTGLTLASDSTTAAQTDDGTLVPRIRATWTLPTVPFHDYTEVWARKTGAGTAWTFIARVDFEETDQMCYISPCVEGDGWTVQVRSVNSLGASSAWASQTITASADFVDNVLPFYSVGRYDMIFNGMAEEGGLSYWSDMGAGTLSLDTGTAYTGTGSFKLHHNSGQPTQARQVLNTIQRGAFAKEMYVRVTPGSRWRVHYAIKVTTNGVASPHGVGITFYDASKAAVSNPYIDASASILDTNWHIVEGDLLVPSNAHFALITLNSSSSAALAWDTWFDDIHIWRMVDVTDLSSQLANALNEPDIINNGNFEDGFAFWSPVGTGTCSIETSAPYTGSKSMKIVSAGDSTNTSVRNSTRSTDDATGLTSQRLIRCAPGDVIRVRAALKAAASSTALVQIATYNASGGGASFITLFSTTSTSFVELEAYYTIPAGQYFFTLFPMLGGAAVQTGWFDEVHAYFVDLSRTKVQTLTDAATIAVDWTKGNLAQVTIAGNRTMGGANGLYTGHQVTFTVIQDATGNRTINFSTNYPKLSWTDAGAGSANKRSSITAYWDGTNWNQVGAQTPWI